MLFYIWGRGWLFASGFTVPSEHTFVFAREGVGVWSENAGVSVLHRATIFFQCHDDIPSPKPEPSNTAQGSKRVLSKHPNPWSSSCSQLPCVGTQRTPNTLNEEDSPKPERLQGRRKRNPKDALCLAEIPTMICVQLLNGSFRNVGVPYFGVLLLRILLFRVLY